MINPHDYYIVPEEYEIALKNGIRKTTLEDRIRKLGWGKKRALTEPTQKRVDNSKWYPIAEKNGIPKKLFLSRINKDKWSPKRAATEPIIYTKDRNRKYSDEIYEKLEANGISKQLFYDRIRRGWPIERAMMEKRFSNEESVKKMNEVGKRLNNRFRQLNEIDWRARSHKNINI